LSHSNLQGFSSEESKHGIRTAQFVELAEYHLDTVTRLFVWFEGHAVGGSYVTDGCLCEVLPSTSLILSPCVKPTSKYVQLRLAHRAS
jgi:hypothetical protein